MKFDTETLERAKVIVSTQQYVNNFRVMDDTSEITLKTILTFYDGNDKNLVSEKYEVFPEYIRFSIKTEFAKLLMYGIITEPNLWLNGTWQVYLTEQGKKYFADKEKSIKVNTSNLIEGSHRKQYDVFISHANKDKLLYVDELHNALLKLGISIFYDKSVLSWGDNWKDIILKGTMYSEFAIIVISNQFFGREWTEIELNEFLHRQNESGQKIILPLLHEITFDEFGKHYPALEFIHSIRTSDYAVNDIAILLAKELIKRYKG